MARVKLFLKAKVIPFVEKLKINKQGRKAKKLLGGGG